jgi:spermidine synthase
MENLNPNGIHYLIEFFGCDFEQLDSLEFWEKILPESVRGTSMKVLHSHFHKFEPQGLTGFLLLSSSHISVHTWPDKNYAACDIFTCACEKETDLAFKRLKKAVICNHTNVRKINRGYQFLDLPIFSTGKMMQVKIKNILFEKESHFQKIVIADTEDFGKCLVLDDIMQCAEKDHDLYDKEMLSKLRKTDKNILILGGGDGYVAERALKLNPKLKVRMFELDAEVVFGSKEYLGQKVFDHKNLELYIGDALHYLKMSNGRDAEKFDGLVCDFTGEPITKEEKKKFESFYKQVIRLSKKVIKKGGWIAVQAGDSDVEEKYIDGAGILEDLLKKEFINVTRSDISIPSYGENDAFLFGEKA